MRREEIWKISRSVTHSRASSVRPGLPQCSQVVANDASEETHGERRNERRKEHEADTGCSRRGMKEERKTERR